VIYGLMPMVERLPKAVPINSAYKAVIFWGGLRGAISLAVVLSLPEFEYRETFVALVMGAVLFTLIVEGLTIEPLVRRLGLDRPLLTDRLSRLEGDYAAKHRAIDRLPELLSGGLFPGGVAMRLLAEYEQKLSKTKQEIVELHRTELDDDDQLRSLLWLRVFAEEKSLYVDMLNKGQLSERSFRQLLVTLQRQVDSARNLGEVPEPGSHNSALHRLEGAVLQLIDRAPALSSWAERLRFSRIAVAYETAGARFESSRRVLDVLDTLARVESTPWYIVDKVRRRYRGNYETAQHQLDQIAEQSPGLINDMQTRLGHRLLLAEELESIDRQAEHGALPSSVAEVMRRGVADQLRELKAHDIDRLKLEPIELLKTMPFFQDISLADMANIAVRMTMMKVPEGGVIARQGECGDHMYFISDGVVRVSREEQGVSRDLVTLMAGDFFGEAALLSREPRNATVTAVTECALYKLHRDDLEVAMATQPAIRKALEEESRKRAEMYLAG
jgi:CPA1 family monovalent cation:H+ antiporter